MKLLGCLTAVLVAAAFASPAIADKPPKDPGHSGNSGQSGNAAPGGSGGNSGNPGNSGNSGNPGKPTSPGNSGQSRQANQSGQLRQLGQSRQAKQSGQLGCPSGPDPAASGPGCDPGCQSEGLRAVVPESEQALRGWPGGHAVPLVFDRDGETGNRSDERTLDGMQTAEQEAHLRPDGIAFQPVCDCGDAAPPRAAQAVVPVRLAQSVIHFAHRSSRPRLNPGLAMPCRSIGWPARASP